jgi:hypothetical protein
VPVAHGDGSTSDDPLSFAQLLLNLLDEGRRTATYKLAVLLALIDCCASGTDASGRAPQSIATRDLARRVLELYWPQVRDYADAGPGVVVLRQSSQPRAVTVDAVRELRVRALAVRATTPSAAERALPREFATALDTIELNLVRMPLGKLQRPLGFSETGGREYPRFLYDDSAFCEDVSARQLRQTPMRVMLRPGVGDWLVSLAGLLRPLLELHWTRQVAAFTGAQLGEDRLRDFLFGAERENLARVRPGLLEAQAGRCFYCAGALRPAQIDVDHFVPWSRVPEDGLQNLVLADRRCNNSKRDHYADVPLLEAWAARPADVLRQVADDVGWPLRQIESRRIARGLYARLPEGTHLWQQPGVFAVLDRTRLVEALSVLDDA